MPLTNGQFEIEFCQYSKNSFHSIPVSVINFAITIISFKSRRESSKMHIA